MTNSLEFRPRTRRRRVRALQSTEERMLVLVLISIVVLFVCCTTPAAVLSVLYSVKLNDHLGFQVSRQTYIQLIINFVHDFTLYFNTAINYMLSVGYTQKSHMQT